MKKLLIFNTFELKNTGGPSGYLFNIRQQLERMNIKNVHFLDLYKNNDKRKENTKIEVKKSVKKGNKHLFKMMISIFRNKKKISIDLNDYDYIHFHRSWEIFKYRKELRNYKGEIILTFHSPLPIFHKLITEVAMIDIDKSFYPLKQFFRYVDIFALKKSDILFFPCSEVLQGYEAYKKIYRLIEQKDKVYIPTGITRKKITVFKSDIRKRFSIPEDSYVYCFVGRHNESKGYDKLKEFGKKYYQKKKTHIF